MDCEAFDRDVVDLLYGDGELDVREALARHAETCSRCSRTLATLRTAQQHASQLPIEPPPEGLSRRILAAAAAPREAPALSRRLARGASWAGSLAMRPQFAMAALFCLAVGSSLLLVRARSGSLPGPTSVREEGLPSPEPAATQLAGPMAEAPAEVAARPAAARAPSDDDPAKKDAPAKNPEAEGSPAASAPAATAPEEAKPALDRALARLASGGCTDAAGDLQRVAEAFPGTPEGKRAGREAKACTALASAPAAPPAAAGSPEKGAAGAPPPSSTSSAPKGEPAPP